MTCIYKKIVLNLSKFEQFGKKIKSDLEHPIEYNQLQKIDYAQSYVTPLV